MPSNHRSCAATLAPKFARLRTDIERAEIDVESGAKTAAANVLDLQRRAIAALKECAGSTVELAEQLGETSCPRDVTCLHLGDWNRCNACFNEQASRFFDQASKFLNAVVASAEPAPYAAVKRGFAEQRSCETFPTRTASFTEAQQRVFELLVTGLPNKLIAYEIGVSEATVKAHVSAVLRKLRVRSRAQAIALSSAFERRRNDYAAAAF